MSTNKSAGRPKHTTGVEARKGIGIKRPEREFLTGATLRRRRAEIMKKTYTSVVKVPSLTYDSATKEERRKKKERIASEKAASSKNIESRIKTFCHAYRVPKPDPNNHSTIAKESPWLTSQADGTDHTNVVQAAFPGKETDQTDKDTIPLNLKQRYYSYKDTGIASWRVAQTKEREFVKLQPSTKNTLFREYAWRLSYLVCQGKREMRMMARNMAEKCGPLPLFSENSPLDHLEFDMPTESESYRHEAIPIASAVSMLFQTADIESFEKQAELKKGLPGKECAQPVVSATGADVQKQASFVDEAIELTGKGALLTMGNWNENSADDIKAKGPGFKLKEQEKGCSTSINGKGVAAMCNG